MDERRVQEEIAAARQQVRRRRVKRGVVAGYIHELSARHAAAAEAKRPEAALAAAAPQA
jgi:hypothetical protein